jgi:energy-coupling factor transporter ATP-binding protein EcfA2
MQWVELMGPHGVGKTTLRTRLSKYYSHTAADRVSIRTPDVKPLIVGWDYNRPSTWKKLAHWREFLVVVEQLYKLQGRSVDVKRRHNFCMTMMRMELIRSASPPGPEVWDQIGSEGMRLGLLLFDPKRIGSYFKTMPVSLGVVILEAKPHVIVERNRGRVPYRPNFSMYAERCTHICSIAAEVLPKRTRVLHLDAEHPVVDNVAAIAKFAGLKERPK